MRALIYQALIGNSQLISKIPAARWFSGGAVEAKPARPFAIFRIVDEPVSPVKSGQPRLEIWVHDNRGSYVTIDDVLATIQNVLPTLVPLEDASHRVVDIAWNGNGPDLVDEGFDTNVRVASYTITGRK